MTDFYHTWSDL